MERCLIFSSIFFFLLLDLCDVTEVEVEDESCFKQVRSGSVMCGHKVLSIMHNNTDLNGMGNLKGLGCW